MLQCEKISHFPNFVHLDIQFFIQTDYIFDIWVQYEIVLTNKNQSVEKSYTIFTSLKPSVTRYKCFIDDSWKDSDVFSA